MARNLKCVKAKYIFQANISFIFVIKFVLKIICLLHLLIVPFLLAFCTTKTFLTLSLPTAISTLLSLLSGTVDRGCLFTSSWYSSPLLLLAKVNNQLSSSVAGGRALTSTMMSTDFSSLASRFLEAPALSLPCRFPCMDISLFQNDNEFSKYNDILAQHAT